MVGKVVVGSSTTMNDPSSPRITCGVRRDRPLDCKHDIPPIDDFALGCPAALATSTGLHTWMIAQRDLAPKGSAISRALDYSLRRWAALSRYLDDGAVPIDNNGAANARSWSGGIWSRWDEEVMPWILPKQIACGSRPRI